MGKLTGAKKKKYLAKLLAKQERYKATAERRAAKKAVVIKTARQLEYLQYLLSPHWKATRARILALRNHTCERCGAIKKLQVHHLTYVRRGAELDTDLQVLCDHCHRQEHDIPVTKPKADPGKYQSFWDVVARPEVAQ